MLKIAAVCEAHFLPLATVGSPAMHVHPASALRPLRHSEWYHDCVRVEQALFDGMPEPHDGTLRPNLSRTGNGLVLKRLDAQVFEI
jgi:hypothetical protein